MKNLPSIAALISLVLLFCCHLIWAAASQIASTSEPEVMFLFGAGLLGLAVVGRLKIKSL
jgi:hypothetical protein